MANSTPFFTLCFLLCYGCFAQVEQQLTWQTREQLQQHSTRQRTDCSIQNLAAMEPTRVIGSEAGRVELWEQNNEQFQCAGVAVIRYLIDSSGLLLPSAMNVPKLIYVVRGYGVQGVVIPGCADTYQSIRQSISGERGQQRMMDQHQKLRRIRAGDVIAVPAGVTVWTYNDGGEQLECISFHDMANEENQLDMNLRKFFLAGNPREFEKQSMGYQHLQKGEEEICADNVFKGFDVRMLAEAFGVGTETARKLQSQDDRRGMIVRVKEGLKVVSPQTLEEEEEEQGRPGRPLNGLEETFCTMRLRENIADASRADVYNPRGGRVSHLNSQKLPILANLQLSAERGVLYSVSQTNPTMHFVFRKYPFELFFDMGKGVISHVFSMQNALMAPKWTMNAHCVMYITKGNGRVQVVGPAGQSVFNGQVRERQVLVVPQNFAVMKKAGNQGLEWITFQTNDNAMSSQLAGRLSVLRSMPVEVLMNSYDISRDEARSVKYNREELTVLSPNVRSQ
ncbi:Cupin 1 [Dillenia turbinata]|uniref:Cupin 1 n=1 Tax=Dillenia turbinata TaxID=194707 RepID=A0AAN8UER2_9MAGN